MARCAPSRPAMPAVGVGSAPSHGQAQVVLGTPRSRATARVARPRARSANQPSARVLAPPRSMPSKRSRGHLGAVIGFAHEAAYAAREHDHERANDVNDVAPSRAVGPHRGALARWAEGGRVAPGDVHHRRAPRPLNRVEGVHVAPEVGDDIAPPRSDRSPGKLDARGRRQPNLFHSHRDRAEGLTPAGDSISTTRMSFSAVRGFPGTTSSLSSATTARLSSRRIRAGPDPDAASVRIRIAP